MRNPLELDESVEPVGNSGPARYGWEREQIHLPAVAIGRLAMLRPGEAPLVDFPANNSGELVPARTVIGLHAAQTGSEVALVFEDGVATHPVIVGVLQAWDANGGTKLKPVENAGPLEVKHSDDVLVLRAGREITLECGKASITLTSAGKLLLRGAYLLSRSSGVNRIKGGSVQIN